MKFYFFIFLFSIQTLFAQTAGSSTLSTIESLAEQEKSNSQKVGDLNRKHLDSYVSEDIKSKRLREELLELENKQQQASADLDKKIQNKLDEIENSTSWKNRRESASRGYKEYNPGTCSAGGPPPICTADHWYRVSIDEALREYNALVERELDKIRKDATKYDKSLDDKRKEISDFLDGDNEYSQLREKLSKEMNELTSKNADIRQKIAELSKKYSELIERESQSIQNNDIKIVMSDIANKHFTILKIGVLEVKLKELDNEEQLALKSAVEKVKIQNEKKIQEKNTSINLKNNELNQKEAQSNAEQKMVNDLIDNLQKELQIIENQLKNNNLTVEKEDELKLKKTTIKEKISIENQKLTGIKNVFNTYKINIEQEITNLKTEVWNLQVNLPQLIQGAENTLKQAFLVKKEIILDAIEGRKMKLQNIIGSISNNRDEFREKVKKYEQIVEPERIRLLNACSSSGASCWGSDIVSKIWGNANKLLSCASDLEINSVLYTGCEEAFSYYQSVLNSNLNGISDEELGKLRRSDPSYEYQRILNKFN